jgi:hypothetical protein
MGRVSSNRKFSILPAPAARSLMIFSVRIEAATKELTRLCA